MAQLLDLARAPTRRPDLDHAMHQESSLRPYWFYSWPYTCPRCGLEGEVRCGVSRNATQSEQHNAFDRQRAEIARDPDAFCPRCRKRREDAGQPKAVTG